MVGLGAGSICTYLGRALPDVRIDVVEVDPGVIAAGRKYFGLQETDKVHFIEGDGRVYLNRSKDLYDLILLDAYRELGVPFHLLTRSSILSFSNACGGRRRGVQYRRQHKTLSIEPSHFAYVFPTVDIYPDWNDATGAQSIAIAVSAARPSANALMQRAVALQEQRHFRYPLPDLVGERVPREGADDSEVLTDDFAPVNLYETIPLRPQKHG